MVSAQPRPATVPGSSGCAVVRPLPACSAVPRSTLPAGRGPLSVAPAAPRREPVRPGARPARFHGVGAGRPVRGGCAPGLPRRLDPRSVRPLPGPPGTPALRLTRRGRRVVAALAVAVGLGLSAALGATLVERGNDLRLAGSSSVVVEEGDTLWSIARTVAPEEDPRAVVYAISEINDLAGAALVPGQVLQLP